MLGINEALEAVGDDSIQHLFEFVEMQNEIADNFYEDFEAKRMAIEIGKAIFIYAEYKERICRK